MRPARRLVIRPSPNFLTARVSTQSRRWSEGLLPRQNRQRSSNSLMRGTPGRALLLITPRPRSADLPLIATGCNHGAP